MIKYNSSAINPTFANLTMFCFCWGPLFIRIPFQAEVEDFTISKAKCFYHFTHPFFVHMQGTKYVHNQMSILKSIRACQVKNYLTKTYRGYFAIYMLMQMFWSEKQNNFASSTWDVIRIKQKIIKCISVPLWSVLTRKKMLNM